MLVDQLHSKQVHAGQVHAGQVSLVVHCLLGRNTACMKLGELAEYPLIARVINRDSSSSIVWLLFVIISPKATMSSFLCAVIS